MHQRKDLGIKLVSSANLALVAENLQSMPAPPAAVGEVPLPSQISVSTVQLEDELIVYEISATIAGHTETQRHAIGIGGTNPKQPVAMSAAGLQAWLDEMRQIVADNAAWHVAMGAAAEQVE